MSRSVALARWGIFLGCMSCLEIIGFGTLYILVKVYWP